MGSYSDSLRKRLVSSAQVVKLREEQYQKYVVDAGIPVHPSHTPDHGKSAKGLLYGGECNVTACRHVGARLFNRATFGYYCMPCARGINELSEPCKDHAPLVVIVGKQLSMSEMNALHRLCFN